MSSYTTFFVFAKKQLFVCVVQKYKYLRDEVNIKHDFLKHVFCSKKLEKTNLVNTFWNDFESLISLVLSNMFYCDLEGHTQL